MAYDNFWCDNNFTEIIDNLKINNYDILDDHYSYTQLKYNINYKNELKDSICKISTETYYQYLSTLMAEKNLTPIDIYGKTTISKEQFSKIASGKNNGKPYVPKKEWLLKIAFAMRLSLDETFILLTKAGHSFSELNQSDFVFIFSLKKGIYNTWDIEELLEFLGLPSLFKSA